MTDIQLRNRFFSAIDRRDADCLRDSLAQDESLVNPLLDDGPFHLAAERGWIAGGQILLSHGGDINARNRFDDTPLQVAVTARHLRTCDWLLRHGADVNATHSRGATAVYRAAITAAAGRDARFLNLLLRRGGQHDLLSAVALASEDLLNAEFTRNPVVLQQHPARASLVGIAIRGCNDKIRQWEEQHQAAMPAEERKRVYRSFLRLLVANGADINGRGEACTAIYSAVSSSSADPHLAEVLIEMGADVNLPSTCTGDTPLDVALDVDSPAVSVLLAHGARSTRSRIDIQAMLEKGIAG